MEVSGVGVSGVSALTFVRRGILDEDLVDVRHASIARYMYVGICVSQRRAWEASMLGA